MTLTHFAVLHSDKQGFIDGSKLIGGPFTCNDFFPLYGNFFYLCRDIFSADLIDGRNQIC